MSFATDTFTDTAGTALASHTMDSGGPWTKHTIYAAGAGFISGTGTRARGDGGSGNLALYWAAGSPASADYTVTADVVAVSEISLDLSGVVGRVNTAADTSYQAFHYEGGGAPVYRLQKNVAGSATVLGNFSSSAGATVGLVMAGTSISLTVNGTPQVGPVTDSSISAAGKAGVILRLSGATAGYHLDNFSAADASSPPPPAAAPYLPLLGVG